MAHLGQIDRRNPGDVVFTRYVTENADWNKLKIRIENGQFAEMFEDKNNELESMNINIPPRTPIKLASEKYKDVNELGLCLFKKYNHPFEFIKNSEKIEVSEIENLIREIIESIIETESFKDSGNPA